MLDWIWLGLETETFVAHETLMALWYADCLLGAHLQNMQITSQKGVAATAAPTHDLFSMQDLPFQVAKQTLTRAILQILCSSKTLGLYTQPNFEFLAPEVHFSRRFAKLTICVTPAPLKYEQYASNTTFSQAQVGELFTLAEDSLKVAKGAIERAMKVSPALFGVEKCQAAFVDELKAMARVCISNSIALKSIVAHSGKLSTDPAPPKLQLFLDFKYHPHFPVLSLVPSATKRTQ